MSTAPAEVVVDELQEKDVIEAERIAHLAFGTFLKVPDPMQEFGDRKVVVNRWRAKTSAVLGAYIDGKLVASNVVSRWGTFGWFGPLTVRPDLWDRGIAKNLMKPTMDLFSKWGTTHQGLFTFAHSPKHIGLYQKFGFNARFLTAIMSKSPDKRGLGANQTGSSSFSRSEGVQARETIIRECRELTNRVFEGLDLSDEIRATTDLNLGDTVVIRDGSRIRGFAICHVGAGTEAGSGRCYVKFAAVEPQPTPENEFRDLLLACEGLALQSRAAKIEAGINLGRTNAYREVLSFGFRTDFLGVAMQRPNEPGFNLPSVFAIDDWR
jgi:predicted N-acetyltransferase YhbS